MSWINLRAEIEELFQSVQPTEPRIDVPDESEVVQVFRERIRRVKQKLRTANDNG